MDAFTYTLTAVMPDGVRPPSPGYQGDGVWSASFDGADLASARSWRRAAVTAGGSVVAESGAWNVRSTPSAEAIGHVIVPRPAPGLSLSGVTVNEQPCEGCALPIKMIRTQGEIAAKGPSPRLPVAADTHGLLIVDNEILEALAPGRLAELVVLPVAKRGFSVVYAVAQARLGTTAPCAACGRIGIDLGTTELIAPATFSIQPVSEPREGFAYLPLYGQTLLVAFGSAVDALLHSDADLRLIPVHDPSQADAWLPEEYR